MVRAACHCGAVRITLEPPPNWVLDCNCSICRRYGGLWAYTRDSAGKQALQAILIQGSDALEAYIWGDRWSAVWRCKTCGCVMYGTALGEPEKILAVNARMFVDFDPASLTIQRIDNAHTGRFWTRPDAEIRKGRHPPMAPPGPDDWR
jgi:hypothetical protein